MIAWKMRWAIATAMVGALTNSFPGISRAWGPEGHDIIVRVAYQRLSPALRAKFDKILANGNGLRVEYQDPKTHKEEFCGATTLGQLANWADCVRYGGPYADTYDNHFDDIPYCPKPPAPPPSKASYCGDGTTCATKSLPGYIQQLRSKTTSDTDRAVALAMVVHVVGDLHQPLHTITNVTAEGKDDSGGNGVVIDETDKPNAEAFTTTLHKVWDGDLVKAAVGAEPAGVTTISALAQANAVKWGAVPAKFDAWAMESHIVAVQAYDALSPAVVCGVVDGAHHPINTSYLNTFSPIVREQLAKASLRLAAVLKQVLTAAP